MRTFVLTAFAGFLGAAAPAMAEDFSDPTWPCVQRKVETLSLGLMWPIALPEDEVEDPALAAGIRDLAGTLAVRRLEMDTLRQAAEEFTDRWPEDTEANLGRAFAQTFKSLNTRRSQIINGIADFSLGQIALAEKIDEMRLEMDTALEAENPDFDRVDELEEKLDWDQVIYSDRQQSITYLCETPQLIEKRLFAIAQMLQGVAKEKE
ncbi:hypothetical protein PVV74_21290 [Roseovarius sp. SK2]|jgi:hypothetical protein|uniref:hypothetical protein n=1 Tax=Roseovarius TaxID=74030 RepID=UPI000CDE3BED|nr:MULTISPECIES: hypothetical protein [Roseovarius]MDD9727989.1 hypothetical protein [Roseovarius sp. SK2]